MVSRTHSSNAINSVTVNLNSNYVTSLKVKLVQDTVSPVQNAQVNYALFNRKIDVRLRYDPAILIEDAFYLITVNDQVEGVI